MLSLLATGACFRDRDGGSGELSEKELAAFSAPADSSLTAKQVDQYLRTSLAQLELLRAEGPAARERMALAVSQRARAAPGAAKGKRPPSPQAVWVDFVDETFVRSARKLGYRPAELLYVRGRLALVSGHLLASQGHAFNDEGAALMRQQVELMRGTPGVSEAQLQSMLQAAERAEQEQAPMTTPPRLAQNLGALRQAQAAVSDSAWGRIASVAAGVEVSELGQLSEAEAGRKLNELRELYLGALENRKPPRAG